MIAAKHWQRRMGASTPLFPVYKIEGEKGVKTRMDEGDEKIKWRFLDGLGGGNCRSRREARLCV